MQMSLPLLSFVLHLYSSLYKNNRGNFFLFLFFLMATFCQNAEEISGVINYVVSNRIQDKHKQLANERKMTRSKKAWKPRLMIFYREAFLVPIIYMRGGKIALNLKNFLKCILSGVKTTAPLSPPRTQFCLILFCYFYARAIRVGVWV